MEEQVGARLVNGEIAQLVENEQRRLGVFFAFLFEGFEYGWNREL